MDRDFLREQCPELDSEIGPGWFVNSEGVKLGKHKGAPYYTIGQRKGLEIALGKTLAIVVYGDLHVSVLDEMPAGFFAEVFGGSFGKILGNPFVFSAFLFFPVFCQRLPGCFQSIVYV